MPYANIYYVKLQLSLLNSKEFMFDLTAEQKWLYLGLFILAGSTKNNVPSDENFLKNRLNLAEKPEKIRDDLQTILKYFPDILHKNGVIKFKGFKKLHNPVRDSQRDSDGLPKVDQKALYSIVEYYIVKKNIHIDAGNPYEKQIIFRRNCKPAKELLLLTGGLEQSKKAIDVVGDKLDALNRSSWTLETVCARYPEWKSEVTARLQRIKDKIGG